MIPRSPPRPFSDSNSGTKPKQVPAEKCITRAAARTMQTCDVPSDSESAVGGDATGSMSLRFPDLGRHQEREGTHDASRHDREIDDSGIHDIPPPLYHESVQTPSIERMLAQFKAEILGLFRTELDKAKETLQLAERSPLQRHSDPETRPRPTPRRDGVQRIA